MRIKKTIIIISNNIKSPLFGGINNIKVVFKVIINKCALYIKMRLITRYFYIF